MEIKYSLNNQFTFPEKCVNCLSDTSESKRYSFRTGKHGFNLFHLDVPMCDTCRTAPRRKIISFTPVIIIALVAAVPVFQQVNALVQSDDIKVRGDIWIGIAAAFIVFGLITGAFDAIYNSLFPRAKEVSELGNIDQQTLPGKTLLVINNQLWNKEVSTELEQYKSKGKYGFILSPLDLEKIEKIG